MNKKNKALLASYTKANKKARAIKLEKSGFSTESEYFAHLGVKESKKTKTKKIVGKATKSTKPLDIKKVDFKDRKGTSTKLTDYVIAFDTTGSMAGYIKSVREHATKVVKELFANTPNLRMKIVAFGDYCDMKSPTEFSNAYQTIELTDNINDIIKFIDDAKNTSGGDADEFYELVIQKINNETTWRDGSIRSVLFIGDCNPHPVGYSYAPYVSNAQVNWKDEAKNAKNKGIYYDTLRIIAGTQWYQELSDITGGVCLNFKNQEKVSEIIIGTSTMRTNSVAFNASYSKAMASGDDELMGAYKTMSMVSEEFDKK